MAAIRILGDPILQKVSEAVKEVNDAQFLEEKKLLLEALENFRKKNGFGRAISAPQIGVSKRFIAMNLGKGGFCIINPIITYKSKEMFTMWDDCMSFPWLLVKVQRHNSLYFIY